MTMMMFVMSVIASLEHAMRGSKMVSQRILIFLNACDPLEAGLSLALHSIGNEQNL